MSTNYIRVVYLPVRKYAFISGVTSMYPPGVGLQEDADVVRVRGGTHDADDLLAVLHDVDHLPRCRDGAVCEQRHQQRHVVHLLQVRPDLVYSPR